MNLELTAAHLLDEYDGLGVEEIRNKYVAAMAKARRQEGQEKVPVNGLL